MSFRDVGYDRKKNKGTLCHRAVAREGLLGEVSLLTGTWSESLGGVGCVRTQEKGV